MMAVTGPERRRSRVGGPSRLERVAGRRAARAVVRAEAGPREEVAAARCSRQRVSQGQQCTARAAACTASRACPCWECRAACRASRWARTCAPSTTAACACAQPSTAHISCSSSPGGGAGPAPAAWGPATTVPASGVISSCRASAASARLPGTSWVYCSATLAASGSLPSCSRWVVSTRAQRSRSMRGAEVAALTAACRVPSISPRRPTSLRAAAYVSSAAGSPASTPCTASWLYSCTASLQASVPPSLTRARARLSCAAVCSTAWLSWLSVGAPKPMLCWGPTPRYLVSYAGEAVASRGCGCSCSSARAVANAAAASRTWPRPSAASPAALWAAASSGISRTHLAAAA
mmetsp:Transcript_22057/g.48175  ORF Transcript_22057/g.48175 Transcript_22057/m.48175 type:complete len:349 (-) Transcript_22057:408-1454(-)